MSTIKEIESALARVSVQDLQRFEIGSTSSRPKINRAQTEIAQGVHPRVRNPKTAERVLRFRFSSPISTPISSDYPPIFKRELSQVSTALA